MPATHPNFVVCGRPDFDRRADLQSERRLEVLSPVLVINRFEVIRAGPDVVNGALRRIVGSIVVFLAELS